MLLFYFAFLLCLYLFLFFSCIIFILFRLEYIMYVHRRRQHAGGRRDIEFASIATSNNFIFNEYYISLPNFMRSAFTVTQMIFFEIILEREVQCQPVNIF